MPVTMPEGYYDRFDPTKNYERHLIRAGYVAQAAEFNEIQQSSIDRLKRIADALFKDGAVIRDARILVDQDTGETTLEAGTLYVRGAMRGVAPRTVTIATTGTVQIGVYLVETVVTELEDPALRDPAIGVLNYAEPGAARLEVEAVWGVAGDGTAGEFYVVYTVIDGNVQSPNPPPNIDAVALAIASYDRQSAGGYYIAGGLKVSQLADDGGDQIYSLSEGVARVDGREVTVAHARRVVHAAVPDLRQVLSEPHPAAGGTERVNLNRGPISAVDQVLINAQKPPYTVTHGAFTGAIDALPDSPVLSIVAVNQGGAWDGTAFAGGTTYVQGADYKLTADAVDWSLAGAEPAPGSTYQVVYRYVAAATPTAVDDTGFTVTGAVAGTVTQVSYRWKRPRIDRLCLDAAGAVQWVIGVANDTSPLTPPVPDGLLAVASVRQTWTAARSVANDGIRTTTMPQLDWMQRQIDDLFNVVSDQQLRVESAISDPTTKKGIFTDPFIDDTKRDAGIAQTAASFDGILTLGISSVSVGLGGLAAAATLPLNAAGTFAVVSQTLRTACMPVNPYMAFEPIPAQAVLNPATDFWHDYQTVWLSPVTRRFQQNRTVASGPNWALLTRVTGRTTQVLVNTTVEEVATRAAEAQFLRQIQVGFTVSGFGPGEWLDVVRFDGRSLAFTA